MPLYSNRHHSEFRTTVAICAVAALLYGVAPGDARAQQSEGSSPEPVERQPYNGASFGPEAHVGYGWSEDGGAVGSGSFGFRHSFVFLFGDSRLSYVFDDSLDDDGLERHGLWLHTCLHPAAAVILGSDWLAYALASPYLELGAGGFAYVGSNLGPVDSPAFGWSLGGGLDLPLANPDRGDAPWLQIVYRRRFDTTNRRLPSARPRTDLFYLGIGWRINGTLF